jgi:tetratricopeptide (TPR) repeat protein
MRNLTRCSLFLILFISCVGNCFAQSSEPSSNEPPLSSPDEYIERGTTLWHKADYDGAILNFTKAIEIDEASLTTAASGKIQVERLTKAYLNRAILVGEALGKHHDAIADLDRAIQLRPQWDEAYNERGLLHMAAKDLYRAVADYTMAIEINPKSVKAYVVRGHARYELRDYIGATEDWNTSIEIDPNYYSAYFYRGTTRSNQRDYKGALADYSKMVELDPDSCSGYELRGFLLLALGRDAEAERDFNKCYILNPSERPKIEQKSNDVKRRRALSR